MLIFKIQKHITVLKILITCVLLQSLLETEYIVEMTRLSSASNLDLDLNKRVGKYYKAWENIAECGKI